MAKKIGIIGATGYVGLELVRLLINHKQIKIAGLCSVSFMGKSISEIYPSLQNINEDTLENAENVINKCDVIFSCVPHGHSEEFASLAFSKGKLFIDMGADFRLDNEKDYVSWYGLPFKYKELHSVSVYSIPEIDGDKLKDAKIIANPGCYPTSVALGLYPVLKEGMVDLKTIIIDSKSGATGAGRELSLNTHFTELNEGFSAYKIANHRHTPEIEQTLSNIAGKKITVTFTPHLLPVNRGILSTIYCNLNKSTDCDTIHKLYTDYYKDSKFVRILPKGTDNNIKYVKYSNYCNIAINVDKKTNRLIVISTIDNMIKGAAGQAIQNMNLHFGFKESEGLELVPPAF